MKRCPTCNRNYTDDSLRFCLEDGALLATASDTVMGYADDATMRAVAPTASGDPPPTEIIDPRALPTAQMSPPPPSLAPTIPQQRARQTAPDQFDLPLPTPTPAAPAPKQQNTTRVVMLSVLATALLIALGGMGAWVLMKNDADEKANNAPGSQKNAVADSQAATTPGNTSQGTKSPNTTDSPKTGNRQETNAAPAAKGRWFVILGSYPKAESSRANERLKSLRASGHDAYIVDTDNYPNMKPGLLALVMGPYTRTDATATANRIKATIPDAYAKSGW